MFEEGNGMQEPTMADIADSAYRLGIPTSLLFGIVYDFYRRNLKEPAHVSENDHGNGPLAGEITTH